MRVTISGSRQATQSDLNAFVKNKIDRVLEGQERSFPERFAEVDQGTYKENFHRYNTLGPKTNTLDGRGSYDYFVPITKTRKPFLIKCHRPYVNPKYLCDVQTFSKDNRLYEFSIPFYLIEHFSERDALVQTLIKRLISSKG